jgi:hypothetical protein
VEGLSLATQQEAEYERGGEAANGRVDEGAAVEPLSGNGQAEADRASAFLRNLMA